MRQYAPQHIRNVALVGHGHCGKTSLAEAMLWASKATTRLGRVEDGNTASDFDPDEIKRRISISASVVPLEWDETKVNLIDTPGYADFVGDVCAALRVVESAVLVVDASAGVEVGTERAADLARDNGTAVFVFVNKMDRENADFAATIASLKASLGSGIAPIQVPMGEEKAFSGVINVLRRRAYRATEPGKPAEEIDVPDEYVETVEVYRRQLIEAIAELDEDLTVRYLDDEELTPDDLIPVLCRGVDERRLIPVFCGSATRCVGIEQLLDSIVEDLPSADRVVSTEGDGDLAASPDSPLTALVFKTIADPHVGRVSYFRVFSGAVSANAHLHNASQDHGERIGHVFLIRGKEHIAADVVGPGDIGAVGKLSVTVTNDTLCSDGHTTTLPKFTFPEPSYAASVHPKTKSDLDKMSQALHRLVEEDPTLVLGRDPITGESILSGMGEPHVQIALERMMRRFGVNVEAGLPRVAYRETISQPTVAEYKHKKQTGGAGQYGHVHLQLEPLPDQSFEFVEKVVGGSVPRNYYPAVEKGVKESMEVGPLAGYPVVNVRVTLTDGSYHDVDSNEMAFKIAAKEAFKKGVLQAKPVLLEPILTVRVTVPDACTGDIMSDLNGKRAHVNGMNPDGNGHTTIEAVVPAAEVQRYATDLRSLTQGRGSFHAEFSHYQAVPPNIAEQIKAAAEHAHGVAA